MIFFQMDVACSFLPQAKSQLYQWFQCEGGAEVQGGREGGAAAHGGGAEKEGRACNTSKEGTRKECASIHFLLVTEMMRAVATW